MALAAAAQHKLTGRVTDSSGEVIPGVTIFEKGTSNGVASDIDGNYTIVLKGKKPVIEASCIGFKKFEQRVGADAKVLDIVMADDVNTLDELVVVGYGQQRRIATVGAQSSIKAEGIKMPAANLSSSISGRLSGVVSVQRSGEPGHDDSDIWIRGISTLSGGLSKPLILVDGVERSFNQIDVNDIEEFSILKDASATAVYGVRGANGVILIKTKPGVVGQPKFTVDYYEGFTQLTNVPKLADGITYMEVANEARRNSGLAPLYKPGYIEATKMASGLIPNTNPNLYNSYLYPNVNWIDEIYTDWGHNRRVNASVRGGVPKATYYVSASYYEETGLTNTQTPDSYDVSMNFNRYNFISNVDLKPTERTTINVGTSGYFTNGGYPYISSGDVFTQAMMVPPVSYPVVYPDGSVPGISSNGDLRNPYADLTRRGYKNEYTTQIYSNLKLSQDLNFWNWSKGLSVYGLVSFDVNAVNQTYYRKRDNTYFIDSPIDPETGLYTEPYDENGNLKLRNTYTSGEQTLQFDRGVGGWRKFYFEGAMNYNRTFGGDHRVGALVLYNMEDLRHSNSGDLISAVPYKKMGIAARATYSYADRYFLELNAGYNGSENFHPDKRFGFFPAVGLAYVPTNEKWWEDNLMNPVLNFIKIRYTNGKVGSDQMGGRRFGYRTIMGSTNGYTWNDLGGYGGIRISDYGVNVQWSSAHKQDLGLDLKLFNSRMNLTFDYFYEIRDKIFLSRGSVPDYIGLNNMPWGNLGKLRNHGLECSFDYTHTFTKNMELTVRGNVTWNEDKVLENDEPKPTYPWMSKIGTNVLARFGYIAEGLFTSMEEIEASPYQFGESAGSPRQLRPGDVKYKDLNGDGVIDDYDQCVIGRGDVPNLYYGFGADYRWGNVSVGVLFQGIHGADRCLNGMSINPFNGNAGQDGNLYSNIDDRWSESDPTNTDVFYPRIGYGSSSFSNTNNYKTSTWWQKDQSFLRLKQLNLAYHLPRKWTEKAHISNAQIYAMGSNLHTWSAFKLWDPELNTNNGMAYPNVRTFSVGLSFNF